MTKFNKTVFKTSHGATVSEMASLTLGHHGPMLIYDTLFMDIMTHFTRERIPERVVHAKGAFGYFEVTNDITKYTRASVFSSIGKRTRIAVRFSGTLKERGGADTVREPHGFSIKFYTDDGIWDIVGLDIPIFFLRDAIYFSSLVHSLKRNPATNLPDLDMFWDYVTLRPEALSSTLYLFSDSGLPYTYRHMNGYSIHAFKLVNKQGMTHYAKFFMKPNQGWRIMTDEDAQRLQGTDPDYYTRDLYNSIARGNTPSWNISIQLMTFEQAKKYPWNPFDITKLWPEDKFPLLPVGVFILDTNPQNYFAQVEQLAFTPGNLVSGIEPSCDRVLHARMFAYPDAHRHRLGPHHMQIPVNCPFIVNNYNRDGPQLFIHQGGAPNYYPNSFNGPETVKPVKENAYRMLGDVARYDLNEEENYFESNYIWLQMCKEEQERLVNRLAVMLYYITERTRVCTKMI
ncbi:hypothetical protein L9F63_016831 [Diploptera punctata]|uniref:Catalase core domain-containing protein n=1 Tax=Diploptera punctata TaxID=6984 RepID=A0AAD7ZZY8_DIPPU|nr:hypothetical protein L9F63_016831 [Diploptera punctata]